jgi:hypothetical protein
MPLPAGAMGRFGSVTQAIVPGLVILGAMAGYQDKVRNGWNPVAAGIGEAVNQTLPFMISPVHYGLLIGGGLVGRAVGASLMRSVNDGGHVRQARTPFSHRFEHTDVTSRAQSLGLQAIGSSWAHSSMGSEAARFAQRYGR